MLEERGSQRAPDHEQIEFLPAATRFGLREVCLRRIELRLERTRIDYEKKLAFLQVFPA